MLGAVDLRRFRENGAAAVAHQQVHRGAQRRVGGNAGVAIRPAALQGEQQVARRHGFAFHPVGFGQDRLDPCDAFAHRFHGAAFFLNGVGGELVAALELLRGEQARDLVRFAAQAHDLHGAEIGVARVAGHGPAQHVHGLAFGGHAAAAFVRERDDAIDIGPGIQAVVEMPGDHARHRGRAVDAGEYADVVARGHAPVGAHDALESHRLRNVVGGFGVGAKGVIAVEVAHGDVVHMDMLARMDVVRGETDDLVVAPHRIACLDLAHGDLVPGGHAGRDADILFLEQRRALRNFDAGDDHVVGGIEAYR